MLEGSSSVTSALRPRGRSCLGFTPCWERVWAKAPEEAASADCTRASGASRTRRSRSESLGSRHHRCSASRSGTQDLRRMGRPRQARPQGKRRRAAAVAGSPTPRPGCFHNRPQRVKRRRGKVREGSSCSEESTGRVAKSRNRCWPNGLRRTVQRRVGSGGGGLHPGAGIKTILSSTHRNS